MPAISKIRFTNVVYEDGNKRYNDDLFLFDGHNGAVLLENGGGKTVFIQTAIQAILPHASLAERKIKDTLSLESHHAHIAIEWILNDRPRRYALTAVTLFLTPHGVDSYRYAYEYAEGDAHAIEHIPFVREGLDGKKRPASRQEMQEYYQRMSAQSVNARTFATIQEYHAYLEEQFKIIPAEWQRIVTINGAEGDVEAFFENCKTTSQLFEQLLIPTVEEALAGQGSKDFAETFERQREHFKTYKRLREQIEENERLEREISRLAGVYAQLFGHQQSFLHTQQRAKAYHQLIGGEKARAEQELEHNQRREKEWQQQKLALEKREASYRIAQLEEKLKELEQTCLLAERELEQAETELRLKTKRYHSLQAARLRQLIQQEEAQLAHCERELSRLDADEETAQLQEQLAKNSAALKGYFVKEEKRRERVYQQILGQLDQQQHEIEAQKSALETVTNQREQRLTEKAKVEGRIEQTREEISRIAHSVLDRPDSETVEEEWSKWETAYNQLDHAIINDKEKLKQLEQQQKDKRTAQHSIDSQISARRASLAKLTEQKETIEAEHDTLLHKVQEMKPEWHHYESLYLRQASIVKQLDEKLVYLQQELEELLRLERLALRFVDDYKERSHFTADPLLAELVDKWADQFTVLETGTVYLQRAAGTMNITEEALLARHPLWPLTVIVSDAEYEKAKHRFEQQAEKMTHPVYVVTVEEARSMLQEVPEPEHPVLPRTWLQNINQQQFVAWKEQLETSARQQVAERKQKQQEIAAWEQLRHALKRFYERYPHEQYHQLLQEIDSIQEEVRHLEQQRNQLEWDLEQLEAELQATHKQMGEAQQQLQHLEQKLSTAQHYFHKKKEVARLEAEAGTLEQEIKILDSERIRLKQTVEQSERKAQELHQAAAHAQRDIADLRKQPFYTDVDDTQPLYTTESYEALKLERESLLGRLNQKQENRSLLDYKMKTAAEKIRTLQKELNDLYTETEEMDKGLTFPPNGLAEMDRLRQTIKTLEKERDQAQKKWEASQAAKIKQAEQVRIRKDDFRKTYPDDEITVFSASLAQVAQQLKDEQEQLAKEKNFLVQQRDTLTRRLNQINDSYMLLDKKHEAFHYLADDIQPAILTEEEQRALIYRHNHMVKEMIEQLEVLKKTVEQHLESVREARQRFMYFCHDQLRDIKLKEMALNGIQHKETYEEIAEWVQLMKKRIRHAIRMAEDDMRGHDQQVQQFITHLHTYLQTIAAELRYIPKKTRVRVDEQWKEIYLFKIPEWNEQEGKEELRKHIDWIVNQLDSDQFKDEAGKEDLAKVKKQIAKWLHPKQLLRIVMKQNEMKVSCRKVSNDGKVSNAPTSWEKSNKWSGGEKWSKNMTLFLGLLNYLAEKRQHLTPGSKRHRTVIVDNPFGKASSDHVLNPVFFIAEQLGFQMIALTAHAEGKFLRDYFPVIYSLKLRPSAAGDRQVMTKEKEIRHAFFRDHDPQALLRLGEVEQLTMF
ncbi:membrane protein [Caldalkalibacillus thermarum]|uniref:hypothetical protein n=1 Tax=Caldalkalibacillus thermarum TaxID=296745 RepID=UPI00166EEF29|nr:hypothetical protein [Caldalkalibacillus thermarum]GGK31548.1 membrane protein [Caldalkalibacillus thermarum]